MRRRAFTFLAVAGCSNLLGLSAPQLERDAAVDGPADTAIDAAGDFTFAITNAHPRVPAKGFDFLDLTVTRAGFDGPILVSVPQPPQGVSAGTATIGGGTSTGELRLDGNQDLTVGAHLALHVVASGGGIMHAVDLDILVSLLPGSPDPTFNGSGVEGFALGSLASNCNDLAIASSGDIALFGSSLSGSVDGAIVQVLANGSGTGVFNPVHSDQGDPDPAHFGCGAFAADGVSVVAGGTASDSRTDDTGQAWLAGFNSVGAPIKPFGDANGFDFLEPDNVVAAVQRDAAGRFVIALVEVNNTTTMARQNLAGAADPDFAGGANLALDFAHITGAASLALDGAGASAYVVGETAAGAPIAEHVDAAGAADKAFGTAADAALATLGSGATAADAVAVAADGSVLIAGRPGYIVRLHADGTLDPTFGSAGVAPLGALTAIAGIGVQRDGKIVVGGTLGSGSAAAPVLVRLVPDGTLDPTYGTNSTVQIPLASVAIVRLQADDNALVCGVLNDQFGAARLTF